MDIQVIFNAALDIQDETARAAFLESACADKPTLRLRIEALLAAHFRDKNFLEVEAAQLNGA